MVATKVTDREGEAWDDLRKLLGGGGRYVPGESEVLRTLMEEECRRRGVAWPASYDVQPVQPLRVAEATDLSYGAQPAAAAERPAPGERVVEIDGEAPVPAAPPGKPKRSRR